jgi:hypothetical protein
VIAPVTTGQEKDLDVLTLIFGNDASTSHDDVFDPFT